MGLPWLRPTPRLSRRRPPFRRVPAYLANSRQNQRLVPQPSPQRDDNWRCSSHNDNVVFMIPDFRGRNLPPGVHAASWHEVSQRFGWNQRRQSLLEGLRDALAELSRAGCTRAWLDGSFVTAKEQPRDFDLVWDPTGVDLNTLDPVLLDLDPPRESQQTKYRGDLLPNVVESASGMPFLEFFQQDPATGQMRGIVEIELEGLG